MPLRELGESEDAIVVSLVEGSADVREAPTIGAVGRIPAAKADVLRPNMRPRMKVVDFIVQSDLRKIEYVRRMQGVWGKHNEKECVGFYEWRGGDEHGE